MYVDMEVDTEDEEEAIKASIAESTRALEALRAKKRAKEQKPVEQWSRNWAPLSFPPLSLEENTLSNVYFELPSQKSLFSGFPFFPSYDTKAACLS